MTPSPTPGQVGYAAYYQRFVAYQHHTSGTVMPEAWEHLPLLVQMCWEVAADAVLTSQTQVAAIVAQINAREAASLEALRSEAEEHTP